MYMYVYIYIHTYVLTRVRYTDAWTPQNLQDCRRRPRLPPRRQKARHAAPYLYSILFSSLLFYSILLYHSMLYYMTITLSYYAILYYTAEKRTTPRAAPVRRAREAQRTPRVSQIPFYKPPP